MARANSGLAYPERFYAAATYAGFAGSPNSAVVSKFSNDSALLLYALYQQATVGPCSVPKPRGWSPIEQSKWTSWSGLGNMASTEAMRLFVKILEEEDPGWYSRVSNFVSEPAVDVEIKHIPEVAAVSENGNISPETKTVPTDNGSLSENKDKDIVSEGPGVVCVYDKWVAPPVSGTRPKGRYEHGAAVIGDKFYIFGGNHNGRYLNDLQGNFHTAGPGLVMSQKTRKPSEFYCRNITKCYQTLHKVFFGVLCSGYEKLDLVQS